MKIETFTRGKSKFLYVDVKDGWPVRLLQWPILVTTSVDRAERSRLIWGERHEGTGVYHLTLLGVLNSFLAAVHGPRVSVLILAPPVRGVGMAPATPRKPRT